MDIGNIFVLSNLHKSFKHLFFAFLYILFVLSLGTMGYTYFMDLSPFDALYFSVVTLSTIGYGDIYPTNHAARVFTIFFIPLGVSAFLYTFGAVSMAVFEGSLLEVFKLERAKGEIGKMRGHTILCGYGEVGEYIAKNIKDIVVIENDEVRYTELANDDLLSVKGDSTKPEILMEAGVERARSIIVALNEDPKTVFTILTVRELNPKIKIYARANRRGASSKMKTAGADYVVCLPEIGGRELISALESSQ